eukprot:SAG11_NODE_30581_length_299_cov_1.740000_2_plen_21_part_01
MSARINYHFITVTNHVSVPAV